MPQEADRKVRSVVQPKLYLGTKCGGQNACHAHISQLGNGSISAEQHILAFHIAVAHLQGTAEPVRTLGTAGQPGEVRDRACMQV